MDQPALVLVEFADARLPRHESFSPFCMKVHRALRYAGLAYERDFAGNPAARKALNPKAQFPILLVDGKPIADSTRILAAIETMSPLAARSTPEARLWEELADGALYGYLLAYRWADDTNWPRVRQAFFGELPAPLRSLVATVMRRRVVASVLARDITRGGLEECAARLCALLDDLDARAPERDFWLGDTLTCADLALFPQLHGYRTELTPVQAAWVESRPRLAAYLDRVHQATVNTRTA